MFNWENSHNYCQEKECLCYKRTIISYNPIIFNNEYYETLNEPEHIMFHGTSDKNIDSISKYGFDSNCCIDPYFGIGTYLSPCVNLASSFGTSIFVCKVKPGIVKNIELTEIEDKKTRKYPQTVQDSNAFMNERLIYDSRRIFPIGILKVEQD